MPKEIAALMTERGYEICGSGRVIDGELLLEEYDCKTYDVDNEVICIAWGKSKYNDGGYKPICCEG